MVDTVERAIYRLGLDDQEYQVAAKRVAAANALLADTFSKTEAKIDPLVAAQRRLAREVLAVSRAEEEGAGTAERRAAAFGRATANFDRQAALLNRGMATGARNSQFFGSAVQQAGFQVGDFAVQVASGQGVLRPFIQQGTQLISMFGPWGAVIGAAGAVVGALAVTFLDLGEETDTAKEKAEAFEDQYKDISSLMDEIDGKVKRTTESLRAHRQFLIETAQLQIDQINTNLAAIPETRTIGGKGGAVVVGNPGFDEARKKASQDRADQLVLLAKLGVFDDGRSRMGNSNQDLIDDLNQSAKRAGEEAERAADKAAAALDRYNREIMRINDSWAKASAQSADAAQKLVDKLDPVAAATRKLAEDQATLMVAMANGIQITGGYANAMDKLDEAYQQQIDPLHELNAAHDQQTRALDLELKMIGLNADERAPYLAQLQAESELRAKNQSLTDAAGKAYIAEAKQLAERKVALGRLNEETQNYLNLLGDIADRGFDRIGGAITEAFATGQIEMAKFGDIGRAIISEMIQLAVQLAVINPIKNWATGGNDSTIGGIFQLIQTGISAYMGWGGGGGYAAGNTVAAGSYMGGGTAAFAEGGSFMVGGSGGTDSQLVQFRASPDERVTITRPDQRMSRGGGVVVNMGGITINSNAGTPEQNQDQAARNAREMKIAVKAAVREVIADQRRPMALLDSD